MQDLRFLANFAFNLLLCMNLGRVEVQRMLGPEILIAYITFERFVVQQVRDVLLQVQPKL